MQIVIDIPKEDYDIIKKSNAPVTWAEHLIKNGTPLPKGHGRLIDANALKKLYDERISRLYALNKKDNPSRESKICSTNWCNNTVDELPTIIEAESEDNDNVH